VQAALTLVKSRAPMLGIDSAVFEKSDLHVHVPAGATPKDGPSAGVAMFLAIASIFADRTVRGDTRDDRGNQLARTRAAGWRDQGESAGGGAGGCEDVMLPARNRSDFPDIPAEARDSPAFRLA